MSTNECCRSSLSGQSGGEGGRVECCFETLVEKACSEDIVSSAEGMERIVKISKISKSACEQKSLIKSGVLRVVEYQFEFVVPRIQEQTHKRAPIDPATAKLCEHACRIIFNFSVHEDVRKIISCAEIIQPLVYCASFPMDAANRPSLETCVGNAIGALANLATSVENKKTIVALGGIPPLIAAVSSSPDDRVETASSVKQHACRALFALSANDANKQQIVAANGLRPLIESLNCSSWHVQWHAAGALANLSISKHNKILIAQKGGCEPFIRLAFSDRDRVKRQVARGLFALAAHEELRALLVDLNGIRALVHLLGSERNEDIQCNALGALGNIAMSDKLKATVVESECVPIIVTLANSGNPKVQRQAARTLFTLSSLDSIKRLIVDAGGLFPLIHLASSSSSEIQRDVAGTLANIAIGRGNKQKIVDAGGLGPLVHLTGSDNRHVRRQAARALFALAGNAKNQREIVYLGGLDCLLKLLKSDETDERKHAAGAIANIATNDDVRADLVACGALESLLQATNAPDKDIQKQAVRGLCNLGVTDIVLDPMACEGQRFASEVLRCVDQSTGDAVFSDVCITSSKFDTPVQAHKVFLFCRGGDLLTREKDWTTCDKLEVDDRFGRQVWILFLRFIYSGTVMAFENNPNSLLPHLDDLISLAKEYNTHSGVSFFEQLKVSVVRQKHPLKDCSLSNNNTLCLKAGFRDKQALADTFFSDIKFLCRDGFEYNLNKVIVCARCPYFNALFSCGMKESRQSTVGVHCDSVVFKHIVEYMYTGYTDIDPDVACDLLMLSNEWDMTGLQRMVEDGLGNMIDGDSVEMILKATSSVSAPRLRARCVHYALCHLSAEDLDELIEHCGFDATIIDDLIGKRKLWGLVRNATHTSRKTERFDKTK